MPDMTLKQFTARKRALEESLRAMIVNELSMFAVDTGLHVSDISIGMQTVYTVAGPQTSFVTDVVVNVPLVGA